MTDKTNDLDSILQQVQSQQLSINDAKNQLKQFVDLGFAKIDLHRSQRQGFPEVIFGEGKSAEQINDIIGSLKANQQTILVTRVSESKAQYLLARHPELTYHSQANIICTPIETVTPSTHYAAIICAGTSDLPLAEEAALTAEVMGIAVKRFYDVGVSGIHRLFENIEDIRHSSVSVVIAGMEGALSSVVSGLVDHPVYAIPTSIGYGANLSGITTLLAMLNGCAPGTSVLNIDNGFGGGYNAAQLIKMLEKDK